MLVEEGTYISNHKGELLNSKSEWHQAKIIRTTTQVIQGGADLLRQQQGGRRVGLWGAGRGGGVEGGVEVVRREGRDQPQDGRVARGPGASVTIFSNIHIWSSFFILVQKMSSPWPKMCLPVEVTRTQCRNSFLNKFTIIRPPNQWIATRTGRRKVMLLPKGWKLIEVSLLVLITMSILRTYVVVWAEPS